MAPKHSIKRRGDDEDSSGRRPKRAGKNKREVTYDTYEEAMDDFEEKGERYRDGERAQRNYERSLELYKEAFRMQQTYDAAYNQARVLYTLATSFLLPPTSQQYLQECIELYRQSLGLTESPVLQIDAGFNLAQACTTAADMVDELEVDADTRPMREEAVSVLRGVIGAQQAFLSAAAEESDMEAAEEVLETPVEVPSTDAPGDDPMRESEAETYETHLPTPSSLVDTVLALVDVSLTLWETARPLQIPNGEQQQSVRQALDLGAQICPPGRQTELYLAEIKVLLSMDTIVWDLYKGEAQPGKGLEKSLEGAVAALSALHHQLEEQQPDEATVRADILVVLAETHSKIGNRMTFLAAQLPPGPSPLAQQSWFHHSQAVTYLTQALDLPTTPDTPVEFKPNLLLQLSIASLARARLAGVNETAQRNLKQLVENAVAYAARAGEALGIPWIRLERAGPAELPRPAGWDAELLGREAVLQQIRVCLYASEMELDIQTKGRLNEGMSRLLQVVKGLGDRRLGARDVQRWVEDVEEAEEVVSEIERGWWSKVLQSMQS